jgi:5'-3' exonuclease
MYNNIIIDANEFYKRAFAISCKTNVQQEICINNTIQLTFSMILKVKNNYLSENGNIYVLADNPTSKKIIRKKLDPDYKVNRLRESDGYYRGIDFLLLICNYYSEQFHTCRVQKLEADDLVPLIIERVKGNTLLCSSDLDWARCISDTVDWYNHVDIITKESFLKKYKFIPNEKTVTLMKSLTGDKSDNIPEIKGISEQIALNIVHNFDDVYELISCIKRNVEKSYLLSDYTKKIILKNEERLIKNHNLVYFCFVSQEEIQQALIDGSFNNKALSILYKSLNFPQSFDKRITNNNVEFLDIFSFEKIERK